MREVEHLAGAQARRDVARVHCALHFVRDQERQHVGALAGRADVGDLEALVARPRRPGVGDRPDQGPHAAVAQIQRLGAPLVAVADDGHRAVEQRLQTRIRVADHVHPGNLPVAVHGGRADRPYTFSA